MKDIFSYTKMSERLAVLLCDRSQRDPTIGICAQPAIWPIDPEYGSGLCVSDGIQEWLRSRGTPHGYAPTDRYHIYPIGGEVGVARRKYSKAERNGTMWRGEYGQERKELLRFLIRWYRSKGL